MLVKVRAEPRPRLFRVDQPHRHAAFRQLRDDLEKGHRALSPDDVQVLDVCGHDPKEPLRRGHQVLEDAGVNFFVQEEFAHGRGIPARHHFPTRKNEA